MSIGKHLATFNLFREADNSLRVTIAEARGVRAELADSGAPLHLCAMSALYAAIDAARPAATCNATLQVPDPDVRERVAAIVAQCRGPEMPDAYYELRIDAILAALPLDGREVVRCADVAKKYADDLVPHLRAEPKDEYLQGEIYAARTLDAAIRKLAGEGGE